VLYNRIDKKVNLKHLKNSEKSNLKEKTLKIKKA